VLLFVSQISSCIKWVVSIWRFVQRRFSATGGIPSSCWNICLCRWRTPFPDG